MPFDRGAHWIHNPDDNPLAQGWRRDRPRDLSGAARAAIRIGPRNAREGELEDYLAALVRANRAIAEAVRGKADVGGGARAADAISATGGRPSNSRSGPYVCGKDLDEVSAADLGRAGDRERAAFCRQGYGALLAKLAAGHAGAAVDAR